MDKEKLKNLLIGALIVIIILLSTLLIIVINKKDINESNFNVENEIENDNSNDSKPEYKFGDSIKIEKLSLIKNYPVNGTDADWSNWHVLEDDGNYITLISDESFGKLNNEMNVSLENTKTLISNNGINFDNNSELRLLNENDLTKYFNCDLNNLSCNVSNSWFTNLETPYRGTLTSANNNNQNFIFNFDGKLEYEKADVLYPIFPIMKISKDNIK